MKALSLVAGCLLSLALASPAAANGLSPTIKAALSSDAEQVENAIADMRRRGPSALQELIELRSALRNRSAKSSINLQALDRVIDRVGGARYCTESGLYWFTDLDAALAEAKATKKPVLSLRMMGKLTDEFSCANSRFFRTTLYANETISKYLAKHYVLHWKSVRPVPKVTIDFGDGRKLERTLTGNSIHYVLDSSGTVIDGLPGLYSPDNFMVWLQEMQAMAFSLNASRKEGTLTDEILREWMANHHREKMNNIVQKWSRSLEFLKDMEENQPDNDKTVRAPNALLAAPLAFGKSRAEIPVLARIMTRGRELENKTDAVMWRKLAKYHNTAGTLDESSIRLIRRENPVPAAIRVSAAKGSAAPFDRMIARFETAVATDTVRNEFLLHRKIHEWLAKSKPVRDVEALNERVYAELFLTPSSDPWIGLVPEDTYTGLSNGGVVSP